MRMQMVEQAVLKKQHKHAESETESDIAEPDAVEPDTVVPDVVGGDDTQR